MANGGKYTSEFFYRNAGSWRMAVAFGARRLRRFSVALQIHVEAG
jgi:hypothetical protein